MATPRVFSSAEEAIADIGNGATIMVAGYGAPGTPQNLIKALLHKNLSGLVCISGPWLSGDTKIYDAAALVASGQVKKAITAPPTHPYSDSRAPQMSREGRLEVEFSSQGTLAERIRAGGAGLGGLLLPTLNSSSHDNGKEKQFIDGEEYALETPLKADYALLRAHKADSLGNLIYRLSQRNWNPIMAMAADVTIVEVDHVVQAGELDPELVITPGIYVDRIVQARDVFDGQ